MNLSLKNQLYWLKNNNSRENLENVVINNTIQSIIQRTFLWMWWITFIVFAVWYYVVSLIKAWTIDYWQYNIAFIASAILWFIVIIVMFFFRQKMKYTTLSILAVLFAILEWIWLAGIFISYNASSVINAFAGASVLFLIMALYWYFTQSDLTKLWTILFIWLISIIVLSLVNVIFIHSSWFDLLISILWLLIFLGLVAWDLQTLKLVATSWDRRLEIIFWISLYLDFINIFLELLRIFWSSSE